MASNPSTLAPIGVDAMTGGYFMAGGGGGGMMSADAPHFHPSVLLEHGGFGFGFGDAAVGAAAAPSDLGVNYAANNAMLASFASHLFATAAAPPLDDHFGGRTPPEMDEGYGAGSGGSSAASLQCPGHSGAMAVWSSSSSSKKPAGTWITAGGSRAVSVHEPYYLAGVPDVAGFHYPLIAAAAANAPASSELSLTLCSKSSPDSALNGAEQCSSGASRSALTELPQARPQPAHFSVVVARSRYAAVAQEVLNDVAGHLLDGVADVAADSCSGGARPSSGSVGARAPSVVSSNRLMASSQDGGEAQRVRSHLLKMLHLVSVRSRSFPIKFP